MEEVSGKRLNILVDNDLHKKLKISAAVNGTTMTEYVKEAIIEKITRDTKGNSK